MRGIPDLQHRAINAIIDEMVKELTLPLYQVHVLYDDLPESSPLQRLVLDWLARHGETLSNETWRAALIADDISKAFLLDLGLALHTMRTKNQSFISNFSSVRSTYYINSSSRPGSAST